MRGASDARRIVKCQRGDWTDTDDRPRPLTTMQKHAAHRGSRPNSHLRAQTSAPENFFSPGGCQLFSGPNPQIQWAICSWKRLPSRHAPRPIAFQIIKLIFPSLHCRVSHKELVRRHLLQQQATFSPPVQPTGWRRSSNPVSRQQQVHSLQPGSEKESWLRRRSINYLIARCVHKSISGSP